MATIGMNVQEMYKNWIKQINEIKTERPALDSYTKLFIEKNIKLIEDRSWSDLEKSVITDQQLNTTNFLQVCEYCGLWFITGVDQSVDDEDGKLF